MPRADEQTQTDQRQAQRGKASGNAGDQTQAAAGDATGIGNAGMQGRSARGNAQQAAPDAGQQADTDSTDTSLTTLIAAMPLGGPALVAAIAALLRQDAGAAKVIVKDNCLNSLATKLTGNELAEVLLLTGLPASGSGRVAHWLRFIHQAHVAKGPASSVVYQGILAGAAEVDLEELLLPRHDAVLGGVLQLVAVDPLTLFPHRQQILSTRFLASSRFMTAMITGCGDRQIWHALRETQPGSVVALAAALNGIPSGWDWIGRLDGAGFSATERLLLRALHPVASIEGQAIITAAAAVFGAEPPKASFMSAFEALKKPPTPPSPEALRTLFQTDYSGKRELVMSDPAKAAWVFGILPGHPFLELAVRSSERGAFLALPAVFQRFLETPMSWRLRLQHISDHSYISTLAGSFLANRDGLVAWIGGSVPPANGLDVTSEIELRRVGLVASDPAIGVAIADRIGVIDASDGGVHAPTPTPAEVHDGPLVRLDVLLAQPAPSAAEILNMVGALGGSPERTTLIEDATRMSRIRDRLDGERFYQALVVLRPALNATLTQLRQKGQSAARVQSLISRSSAQERLEVVRKDANVAMVRAIVPEAPLQLFSNGELDLATLAHAAWRAWVLEVTPIVALLPLLGDSAARATTTARHLDAAGAWGFLARAPSGSSLGESETKALANLLAATGLPAAKLEMEAKLNVGTASSAPTPSGGMFDAARMFKDVSSSAPEAAPSKSQLFEDEVLSAKANGVRICQLAGDLSQQERTTLAEKHRARLVSRLGGVELARFVGALGVDLGRKLEWLRASRKGVSGSELIHIVASAKVKEQVALFDSAEHVSLIRDSHGMGPLQALSGLSSVLPLLARKLHFWRWAALRCTSLDLLKYVASSRNIPMSLAHLAAAGHPAPFGSLPRGTGLSQEARTDLDLIMQALTVELASAREIFSIRFDVNLTGGWASSRIDDIKRLYEECQTVPIAHVSNNAELASFKRGRGGGGAYFVNDNMISIDDQDVDATETTKVRNGRPPVTERQFDHTVRHEIGHSVDALLGGRTSLVYGQAGWQSFGAGELDQWIQSFDGWNPNGGVAPSDAQKQEVRDLIVLQLQSGGGTIDGPSTGASAFAPEKHAWHVLKQMTVVDGINSQKGTMNFANRFEVGGRILSINYYYRSFMSCGVKAKEGVARDYTLFAPEEWFADMYAEYYRNFDGTNDGTLGGNCPGWVQSWFFANVHNVGGRTPQKLHGRALPPGKRAHI